jgi:signal transduction histidine kinase
LFLGPPREGFYDLAAVRWHARLSLVLGRAVHAAELTAGILRADRLAQLGTLSAGIAHEIRNPLSAMLGALELLQQGLPPEQERQFLEVLREEVLRLDGTVTELLDYSSARPASARCEWTQVFDRVEKLTRRAGLTLERAGAPAELAISGGHLQQILVNLVKNAARAAESAAEPRVDARADVRGGRATITVGDNGPGIAPEIMTRLFTPFASAAPGGTGLGLAMVKRLAELYGGRVWAENRAVGARFCVELPLAAASPAMLE